VLVQQLRELVSDGVVQRHPTGTIPKPVEDSLTQYGRSVLPLVEALRLWGRAHLERVASETEAPGIGPGASA
jgi:DNA-binding HxlR family transcriptional regulator